MRLRNTAPKGRPLAESGLALAFFAASPRPDDCAVSPVDRDISPTATSFRSPWGGAGRSTAARSTSLSMGSRAFFGHHYSSPLRTTKRSPATAKPARGSPSWLGSTRTTWPCPWIRNGGAALLPGGRKALSLMLASSGGGLVVRTNAPLTLRSRVRPMPSCGVSGASLQKKATGTLRA
jgi:hypothetical protein